MTYLTDLINPPPLEGGIKEHYQFFNSVHDSLDALTYVTNPSVITHANFDTLSAQGLTPTTQADGDNFEFIKDWFVFGASNANYTITPTAYPANSTVKSASDYYVNVVVTSHNGDPFYFYQRQSSTVRKYQKDYLTYGLRIKNNQSKVIKVRVDIYSYYDTDSKIVSGKTIFLQPGVNELASTLLTETLNGISVGAGNYTEFRFVFEGLLDGTADIDIYQLKCEFGKISTPLQQQ